jgi:hypothetical protein
MIASQSTSSSEPTNPLRTLRSEDSRAPTTPVTPRAFNGELAAETSGKRVRPDATTRGIGPGSEVPDRTQPTMEVRSSELECLSELHSVTGELQIPWMRNDFRFVLLVGGGAFLLVISMLLVMSRSSENVPAPAAKVSVTSTPVSELAKVNTQADVVPAQESQPFVPTAAVTELVPDEEPAPAPAKKKRVAARKTRAGARAAVRPAKTGLSATAKASTRTTKARKPVRKSVSTLQR